MRDRLRTATMVYLDHIAAHLDAWAMPYRNPGMEPALAAAARLKARHVSVADLDGLLQPNAQARRSYALWGYLGFIDTALGALEGALADWAP